LYNSNFKSSKLCASEDFIGQDDDVPHRVITLEDFEDVM